MTAGKPTSARISTGNPHNISCFRYCGRNLELEPGMLEPGIFKKLGVVIDSLARDVWHGLSCSRVNRGSK